MQIYVINLDRHPARMRRMESLLQGLAFKRIAAVEGKHLDGPEYRDPSAPKIPETLSRYNRGCILSHRAVWQQFLAGENPYGCVLEDDVFISPDFNRFINREDWIPADCHMVKIETTQQEIFVARAASACLDRRAALLRSLHFGTAGYVVSRRGAQAFLDATLQPDRAIDRILFEAAGLKKFHPIYQLIPALCIQASHQADGMIFPEMESSIQPKVRPGTPPQIVPARKTLFNKIKRELSRPFRQLNESVRVRVLHRLKGVRRCRVPFA